MTFKTRLTMFLAIFCIVILTASSQVAKGKPDKPENPGQSHTEWIEFTGDLIGGQPVDDCCPNAGPFPGYRMYLSFWVGDNPPGWYDGQLFINNYGAGRDHEYKVQFWNNELCLWIEIIGGVIYSDRKTKVLTVIFTKEDCVDRFTDEIVKQVSFTLVRGPYNLD